MLTIYEPIYDAAKGRDVNHPIPVDYNPKAHKTAEAAAKALAEALRKVAVKIGQNETEVALFTPERSEQAGTGKCWRVIWEGGPFEWAIGASFQVTGPWGYTEPYYSFDLCFVE